MEKDIIQSWKDPLNSLFFSDPVTTSDGQTYEREEIERWLEKCTAEQKPITSPLTNLPITTVLTPSIIIRNQVGKYLSSHPELYEKNKVYLPQSLKNRLVDAISSGNLGQIKTTLEKDPRLITVVLNNSGDTAFTLSLKQISSDVLRHILISLPAQKIKSFKLDSEDIFSHTKTISQHLGLVGLGLFSEVCGYDAAQFYNILAFKAASKNEVEFLKTLLPKITITVFEKQNNRTLLHTAVLGCCERLKQNSQQELSAEDLVMIRTLFAIGANGKAVDRDGFTPSQLAYKVGYPEVAQAVETERRRTKLAPLLAPLESTLSKLLVKNTVLEEKDAAQSLRIMQLEQQLAAVQVTHGKQLAVSQALLDLEEQKKLKSFVPSILRSINLKDAVKSMISVGPHFLVCLLGKKEDHHGGSSLAIIDLRQTSDKCLLKIIELDARNSNLRRFSFAPVDDNHFIYSFEVEKNQQDKQDLSEIILWNISNLQQENSFQVSYKGVNIIEALTAKRVLISGTKNYKSSCAILELKTGKVQAHPHLEIIDFNTWHDRIVAPTYFPGQVDLAYLVYESERNRTTTPKELRLYNCETFQNTVITSENIKDFEASSSKAIFKFISPTLIAISNRSQYENRGNIHLRLLNTETKLYTQTFSPPELKVTTGWGNTPSYQGFFDACLLPDDVLVAICDDPESKNASECRLLMWNLKTAQLIYNISVQGNARRLHYDEQRDVLYCSNNNQIQVYQVKPTSMKSLPKPASSTHPADDPQTFTGFNSK